MQMVASVKMRRAQQAVLASRPYSDKMVALLANLAAMPQEDQEETPRLLERRDPKRITLIHITPDRGLCGALPGNLNRTGGAFMLESQPQGPVSVVSVGRKGRDFMVRYARELRAVFEGLGDRPSLADVSPIARLVIYDFIAGETDAVYLIYARFVNTVTQSVAMTPMTTPGHASTDASALAVMRPAADGAAQMIAQAGGGGCMPTPRRSSQKVMRRMRSETPVGQKA